MPKRVQLRRGNTAQHAAFTGAQGEATFNTQTNRLTLHDGSTAGGHPHALIAETLLQASNLSDLEDAAEARGNLGVFSRDESYGLAGIRTLTPRCYFNGYSSGQRSACALGFTIGTREFSVRIVFRYVAAAGTARTLFYISTSNAAPVANGLSVHFTASGELEVRLYGASTGNYGYQQTTELFEEFAGEIVELHLVRTYNGLVLYVNGAAVATTAPAAFGTAPGFTATIASTYLVVGDGVTATSPFVGEWLGLSVLNYALTAAQSAQLLQTGISGADQGVEFSEELILSATDQDFSGASNWSNVDMSAYDEAGDLSVTATGAGQKVKLPAAAFVAPDPGQRCVLLCDVANLVGGPFALYSSAGDLLGTVDQNGKFSCTFVAGASFGDLELRALAAGSVDIDNVSLLVAAAPVDLSFADASHYCVPGRPSTAVDALHLGTRPDTIGGRRTALFVRGTTATNGNEKLLGDVVIQATARISAIAISYDASGTAVTSVDVGSTSGGADIASAVPISLGMNDVTLLSRFSSTGEIWIKANGNSPLFVMVVFDDIA